ncbi:MAG: hypothetical protein ACI4HI_08685 [Lachnospiraceae bacterium]
MNRSTIIRRILLFALWACIMALAWRQWNVRHSASEDVEAPVLNSVQWLTSTAPLAPGSSLTLEVDAQDASGIASYSLTICSDRGEVITLSYPTDQSQHLTQMIASLPSDLSTGTYEVTGIQLTDLYNNTMDYTKQSGVWYAAGNAQGALNGTQTFAVAETQAQEEIPPAEETQVLAETNEIPSIPEGTADSSMTNEIADTQVSVPVDSIVPAETGNDDLMLNPSENPADDATENIYTDGENQYEIGSDGEFVEVGGSDNAGNSDATISEPAQLPSEAPSQSTEIPSQGSDASSSASENQGLLSITPPKAPPTIQLPGNFTVQMNAKDDTGFQSVDVILSNQDAEGNSGRFSQSLKGIRSFSSVTFCLQQNALNPGIYHVSEIVLTNGNGDKKCYYRKEKVANGVRTYDTQWYLDSQPVKNLKAGLKLTIKGDTADTEGPKMKSISGLTYIQAMDVDKAKILLKATDQTGISNAMVSFRRAGQQTADRTSYAQLSGKKSISSFTVDIYHDMFEEGVYLIDKLVLIDTYGNANIYTCKDGIWSCNNQAVNTEPVTLRFEYKKSASGSTAASQPGSSGSTIALSGSSGVDATLYFGGSDSSDSSTTTTRVYTGGGGNSSGGNSTTTRSNSNSSRSSSSGSSGSSSDSGSAGSSAGSDAVSSETTVDTIDEKVIKKAFKKMTDQNEAVIDIKSNPRIPPKAFKLLSKTKQDESSMLLQASDYQWRFAKKDLTNVDAVSGFFNAEILTGDKVAVSKLKEYEEKYQLDDMDQLKYQIMYTSDFPGKASISLKWSTDFAGMSAFVYELDENGETAPMIAQTEVTDDGMVSFDMTKGGSGFITVQEVVLPETDEERQLKESIAESEKLSNNKMKQGILLVVGAAVLAVILCTIIVLSKRKKKKKKSKKNQTKNLPKEQSSG